MFFTILLLLIGLVLLIKGAEWLVNGSSSLARKYNISELVIGLTIVAFGTSSPELVVNTIAAFENHPDLTFGNVIGSNIVNLLLILGIAGIITPMIVQRNTVWKEIPLSFVAIIVLLFLVNDHLVFNNSQNILSRFDGIILLICFSFFIFYIFLQMKKEKNLKSMESTISKTYLIWFFIIIGLASLIVGGKLIVNSAVKIATVFNISEKIISLTIIAIGTSLPELATSVVAALKNNKDLAIGNIIGSNIFNIFLILGISSLVRPLSYRSDFNFDLNMLAGFTLLLFIAMFTGVKKKLDRWEALLLLLSYIAYTIYLLK